MFSLVFFSYNISLGSNCILIIIFIFVCLVSPRSYIVTLIPSLNKFHKQTNKQRNTQQNIYGGFFLRISTGLFVEFKLCRSAVL